MKPLTFITFSGAVRIPNICRTRRLYISSDALFCAVLTAYPQYRLYHVADETVITYHYFTEYKSAVNYSSRVRFKRQIAVQFGAKSAGYSANAIIQQELLDLLTPCIMKYNHTDTIFIDTGCGNGLLEQKLADLRFSGTLYGLDIARGSLLYAASHITANASWICGDMEAPPIKPGTATGVVAASVLQWFPDPTPVLSTIRSLIVPEGVFIFSMFTGQSFHELAEIRRRHGLTLPVHCPSSDALLNYLTTSGFHLTRSESFKRTLYFPSAMELLRHLSSIGSTAVPKRMSRSALSEFCRSYEDTFGTDKGIPLTYEAFTGACAQGASHD